MIMEVCADSGQIRVNLNAMLPQIGGGTDAATKQDLRRAVRPGAENDEIRAQLTGRLPIHPGADAEGLPVRDEHPVHSRVGHDREFAAVPHRVEIREGRIPPDAVDDVHQLRSAANLTVEIIEVVGPRDAHGDRSFKKSLLERLDLVGREVAQPKSLDRSGEQRPQLLAGPSRAARCRPGIVVAPPSGKLSAAVVGGASAYYPGPFEGQLLASRTLPPVSPVVCLWKRARIKKLRRPAANTIADTGGR